jgi:hypothetical protein
MSNLPEIVYDEASVHTMEPPFNIQLKVFLIGTQKLEETKQHRNEWGLI